MKRPQFVAEISANHEGRLEQALLLTRIAAYAGADMVKFQTFDPGQMVGDPDYIIPDGLWAGTRLIDLYTQAHTPREWHPALFEEAREYGLTPISSPFHPDDVDFLESIGCEAYKIAGFEIGYADLLRAVAATGKRIILSTGAAEHEDIHRAMEIIGPGRDITLLKCTSSYPATEAEANLAAMTELRRYGCDVGVSDHSIGTAIPAAATALGATMIEKHIKVTESCLDAAFSLTQAQYTEMVDMCERVAESIGSPILTPSTTGRQFQRGLWYDCAMREGDIVGRMHIKIARPGGGIPAAQLDSVIGGRLKKRVFAGTQVLPEDFE